MSKYKVMVECILDPTEYFSGTDFYGTPNRIDLMRWPDDKGPGDKAFKDRASHAEQIVKYYLEVSQREGMHGIEFQIIQGSQKA